MSKPIPDYSNPFKLRGTIKNLLSREVNASNTLRKPIEYRKEYYGMLILQFKNCTYPFRNCNIVMNNRDIETEIKRFMICLDAYLESPYPKQDAFELMHLAALGPEGSKIQKNFKTSVMLNSFRTKPYEENPDLKPVSIDIYDIGQVFNYTYLPFWKEEDPDDYLKGFIPVDIDPLYLDKFEKTIENLLPDVEFEEKDWREFVLNLSEASKLNPISEKSEKGFLLMHKVQYPAKEIGLCKRCVIPVKPQGYRDTVICNPAASVRISWIDSQLMRILRRMDDHIQLSNRDEIEKRISKLRRKYDFFYMRDIQKEGITKPRALLKVMLRVLYKKYPNLRAFEFEDFYESFELLVDNEKLKPDRGHGLGMANCLTTLMNIAIYYMSCNEDDFDNIENVCSSLSLNDDFVAGFKTLEDLNAYEDKELKIMNKLSLLFAPKKSFYSDRGFVIAEEYYFRHLRSQKESYVRAEILKALCCVNITHAKNLVNSYIDIERYPIWDIYKEEILSHWGYEFFPDEYQYPYRCGGWISEEINGLSLDLDNLDQLPYKSFVYRAFEACKQNQPKVYRKPNKAFIHPINIFGNVDIQDIQKFMVLDDRIFSTTLRSKTAPEAYEVAWERLRQTRQRIFKEPISIPFEQFIRIYVDYYNIDYLPLSYMVDRYIKMDIVKENLVDIYYSNNPIISCLLKSNPEISNQEIGELYSIQSSEESSGSKREHMSGIPLSAVVSAYNVYSRREVGLYRPRFLEVEDDIDFQRSYIHPIRAGQAFYCMRTVLVPILKEEWRPKLINEKEKVFGRLIPFDLRSFFEQFDRRTDVKSIIDLCDAEEEDICDIEEAAERKFQEYLDSLEPDLGELTSSSDSGSDEDFDISRRTESRQNKNIYIPPPGGNIDAQKILDNMDEPGYAGLTNSERRVKFFLQSYASSKISSQVTNLLAHDRDANDHYAGFGEEDHMKKFLKLYRPTDDEEEGFVTLMNFILRQNKEDSESEPEIDYWAAVDEIPEDEG